MRPLAIFVVFFLSLSAAGQQAFDPRAVDKLFNTALKAWQIPGAAVAIVRNDRIVYVQGYGTKTLGAIEPVTPDTLFQIASTSKAFTTAALSMLVAEGKLSWDDPVRKHLPYFQLGDPCADAQVTVRDLVSHRTGVGRYDELWDNTPITREEVIRSMGKVELSKPFRTTYQYQNIMFIAAGEVVASASGMPWDDYVRTRIFTPLAMTSTITSDEAWSEADHANGYQYDWETNRVTPQRPIETHTLGSAGAIKSSARDLANWVRFQLNPDSGVDETKQPHTVIRLENSSRDLNPETHVMSYGLGWFIQDYRGELLVSHSGSLNGFRAHVDLLPKRDTGFAILINVGRGYATIALRNALADMLSGKPSRDWNSYYLMLDRRADEKDARTREEQIAKRIPNTTPTLPLERYVGDYESDSHGKASVALVDGQLVLRWNRVTSPMAHVHYDVFHIESKFDSIDDDVPFRLSPRHEVESFTLFGETFVKRAARSDR
ncbi:MAG TPA: serine hydrolase [Thermoanaerobaculia bacterium]